MVKYLKLESNRKKVKKEEGHSSNLNMFKEPKGRIPVQLGRYQEQSFLAQLIDNPQKRSEDQCSRNDENFEESSLNSNPQRQEEIQPGAIEKYESHNVDANTSKVQTKRKPIGQSQRKAQKKTKKKSQKQSSYTKNLLDFMRRRLKKIQAQTREKAKLKGRKFQTTQELKDFYKNPSKLTLNLLFELSKQKPEIRIMVTLFFRRKYQYINESIIDEKMKTGYKRSFNYLHRLFCCGYEVTNLMVPGQNRKQRGGMNRATNNAEIENQEQN